MGQFHPRVLHIFQSETRLPSMIENMNPRMELPSLTFMTMTDYFSHISQANVIYIKVINMASVTLKYSLKLGNLVEKINYIFLKKIMCILVLVP